MDQTKGKAKQTTYFTYTKGNVNAATSTLKEMLV